MPGQPNPGQPSLMVVEPEFYEVSYAINPWMRPDAWARDAAGLHRAARASFEALVGACEATGARVIRGDGDPLAELVRVHRFAEGLVELRGIDPDQPPHLTRSIVLTEDR